MKYLIITLILITSNAHARDHLIYRSDIKAIFDKCPTLEGEVQDKCKSEFMAKLTGALEAKYPKADGSRCVQFAWQLREGFSAHEHLYIVTEECMREEQQAMVWQ